VTTFWDFNSVKSR